MKIILLSPLAHCSGNHTTIYRLKGHFERNGIPCQLASPESFGNKDEFSSYIRETRCTVILAIHAYKSGWLLPGCSVPYILILGGTDVNECTDAPDKMVVMTQAIQTSRHVVCFGPSLRDKFSDKWPYYRPENISIIPQAVETNPSMFNIKQYIQNNIQPWQISCRYNNISLDSDTLGLQRKQPHIIEEEPHRKLKLSHDQEVQSHDCEMQSHDGEMQSHDQIMQSLGQQLQPDDQELCSCDQGLLSHDQDLKSHDQELQSQGQERWSHDQCMKIHNKLHNSFVQSFRQNTRSHNQKEENQNKVLYGQRMKSYTLHSCDQKQQSHNESQQTIMKSKFNHRNIKAQIKSGLLTNGHGEKGHSACSNGLSYGLNGQIYKVSQSDDLVQNGDLSRTTLKSLPNGDGNCYHDSISTEAKSPISNGDGNCFYDNISTEPKSPISNGHDNCFHDNISTGEKSAISNGHDNCHHDNISSEPKSPISNGYGNLDHDNISTEPISIQKEWDRNIEEALFFTIVGGIRAVKDPLYLVDAFSEWAERQEENCYLLIIGPKMDHEYFLKFKKTISRLQYVIYIPGLSLNDTHAAIRDSFALVNTSHSEGMAVSILEAMCLKTPVLARDIPGNRNIIQDGQTGLLFDSIQDFFVNAELLLKNRDEVVRLTNNASLYIKHNHAVHREEGAYVSLAQSLCDK